MVKICVCLCFVFFIFFILPIDSMVNKDEYISKCVFACLSVISQW